MNNIYALSIDSILKTFAVIDGGVDVRYLLSGLQDTPILKEGDILIGFISQGINEFRSAYRVVSVNDNTIEFTKEIDRTPGVPIELFMPQLAGPLEALLGGNEIVNINKEDASNLYALLLAGLKKPADHPPPESIDKLGIALKLFEKYRGDASRKAYDGWDTYDAWAVSARDNFAKIDAAMLTAGDFDYAKFMWKFAYSHTVANTCFQNHTLEDRQAVGDFLAANRALPHVPSWYINEQNLPNVKGFSAGVALNFMMKMLPEEFATFSPLIDEMLIATGVIKSMPSRNLTLASYEASKSAQGVVLARMHELKIGKVANDNSAADYLTVNEFAWWMAKQDNKDLIKEKVMAMKMKDVQPTKYNGARKPLNLNAEDKDDELLLRLLSALRAKPFAILAGHSGTGKSRYVKKLAYMTCDMEELRQGKLPGNYLCLQVKPNWHDSTDLLGFRNAMSDNEYQKTALIEFLFRAYHFKNTPFFLCLDEMNLAPVEQYFAEFLSSMESEEPLPLNDIRAEEDNLFELGCEWTDAKKYLEDNGFSIPKNLFIVGTVNMDETTNQFSRKVLDRAFTIEMTDVDFTHFGNVTKPSYDDILEESTIAELLKGEASISSLDDEDKAEDSSLIKIQKSLEPTPFAIAYRFANEYTLLKRAIKTFDAENKFKLDALDQAVLMKILPRIAGESDYIKKIYDGLKTALVGKDVSIKKINEIVKRVEAAGSQYITFWP